MKPTKKQKFVASLIEEQAKFWQNTNDINSSTHFSDIGEEINKAEFYDILTQEQVGELELHLSKLLIFIQKLNK